MTREKIPAQGANGDEYMSLEEAAASRLVIALTDDSSFAITGAYIDEADKSENKSRQTALKKEVQSKGWAFTEFTARWVAAGIGCEEKAILIKGISFKKAFELCKRYDQKSFIYKNKHGIAEVCANDFEKYSSGDIVKTYHIDFDKPLNAQLASELFSKRKEPFELFEKYLLNARLGFTDLKIIIPE